MEGWVAIFIECGGIVALLQFLFRISMKEK